MADSFPFASRNTNTRCGMTIVKQTFFWYRSVWFCWFWTLNLCVSGGDWHNLQWRYACVWSVVWLALPLLTLKILWNIQITSQHCHIIYSPQVSIFYVYTVLSLSNIAITMPKIWYTEPKTPILCWLQQPIAYKNPWTYSKLIRNTLNPWWVEGLGCQACVETWRWDASIIWWDQWSCTTDQTHTYCHCKLCQLPPEIHKFRVQDQQNQTDQYQKMVCSTIIILHLVFVFLEVNGKESDPQLGSRIQNV